MGTTGPRERRVLREVGTDQNRWERVEGNRERRVDYEISEATRIALLLTPTSVLKTQKTGDK